MHSGSCYLFAEYMVDATARVEQFDYEGKRVREVALPGLGSVSGFNGKHDDPALYFGFENYAQPPTLYRFEPKAAPSASIAPRRRRSSQRITSPSSASTRATAPGCRSSSATARG